MQTLIVISFVSMSGQLVDVKPVTNLVEAKTEIEKIVYVSDGFRNAIVFPFPECEYEDSANCYWNAEERGNGVGKSFVDIDGMTFFIK